MQIIGLNLENFFIEFFCFFLKFCEELNRGLR
jgi:hypothetical protein